MENTNQNIQLGMLAERVLKLEEENEKLKKIIQEQHQIIKQQQKTIIEHISKEIGI